MSYIWENYTINKKFIIGTKVCPYIEVFSNDNYAVEVNPLLRFTQIFNSSYYENCESQFAMDSLKDYLDENGTEQIINILFHYLSQLDRCKGLDSIQRKIEKLGNEIEKGLWGSKIQELSKLLKYNDRECILYILSQRIHNDNQSYFMEAISRIFGVSSLCYEKKTKLYYLYIGAKCSDYNENILELIKILFWTLNHELVTIWGYHYGIIGSDDTMHIDSIQIVLN